ncbi:MAG: hypothetical protein KH941_18840, partial [Clostridiales bacterium]|nr:hypothetical protein [Clostridiales bacterium]
MPRAVPLKWQEKYNNRQKFIEKRADHPYSEIIVQEELLVFYNIGNIVQRTYFRMFHRSLCSLLQSLMLLSLSVSPSQLKLGRKGKERTLRSV